MRMGRGTIFSNFAVQYWDSESSRSPVSTRFPKEWQQLSLFRDHNSVWQEAHPIVALLSAEDRKEVERLHPNGADWHPERLDGSPSSIARNFLRLAIHGVWEHQEHEWEVFQAGQPKLVQGWWQTLSNATGRKVSDIAVMVANSQTTVLVSAQGLTRWKDPSRDPNPLPKVTDPEFLLVEVNS
jgi:hypothetical protein